MVEITPDFSDAADFEPVPAGNYPVIVKTVLPPKYGKNVDEVTGLNANGEQAHKFIEFRTMVDDTIMPEFKNRQLRPFYASVSGSGAGYLLGTLKAFIPGYKKGDKFTTEQLAGAKGIAVVSDTIWEGKKSNNIDRFLPR